MEFILVSHLIVEIEKDRDDNYDREKLLSNIRSIRTELAETKMTPVALKEALLVDGNTVTCEINDKNTLNLFVFLVATILTL